MSAYAGMVGKALKKLQDAISDWHDWLMLGDEAHRVLGRNRAGLTGEIERVRDRSYESAMSVAGKMRGRLMGEWLAGRPSGRSSGRHELHREPRLRVVAPVGSGTDPSGSIGGALRGTSKKKNRIGSENIVGILPHE